MKASMILGPLDFVGIANELILIELDSLEQIAAAMHNPVVLFMPENNEQEFQDARDSCFLHSEWCGLSGVKSIARLVGHIKRSKAINVNFVIHNIDKMDLDLDNRNRGRTRKGNLMTLTPKALKGSNVFITSESNEYMLRELCDRYIDLRCPSTGP